MTMTSSAFDRPRCVAVAILLSIVFVGCSGAERTRSTSTGASPAAVVPPAASDGAPAALAVVVPAQPNGTCPIMGKPASESLWAETAHGRIYVCCAPCIRKIRADPERAYEAAYPTVTRAANAQCPITGRPIEDGATAVVLQGISVSLCCGKCEAPARERSQIALVKATRPRTRDVGNVSCPVSGEPVDPDTIVLIGDELVRLHSKECVESVQARPLAVLETARALAEQEPERVPEHEVRR